MSLKNILIAMCCTLYFGTINLYAQDAPAAWTLHSEIPQSRSSASLWVSPTKFQLCELNPAVLLDDLKKAPFEHSVGAKTAPHIISLPAPSGNMVRFALAEYSMMEPGLAEQFPEIKTYLGTGVDDPHATIRADWTPNGFHASVLSPEGSWYIDPLYKQDVTYYASYNRADAQSSKQWTCDTPEGAAQPETAGKGVRVAHGTQLRTYRLACAATGEYTAFYGGTVSGAQAGIVTTVNRINQIYEQEIAVRLTLVANNASLVYTNGTTDPYTNNSGSTMLSENQTNVNAIIGAANYDIGHVFSTGGGGIAALACVCANSTKARGVTGSSSPIGDPFNVDYVAHEIGHQFAANHTFNSVSSGCGGNRASNSAYEPGSASTIMGYAGLCSPDNLQLTSDPYFHSRSIEQMISFITTAANSCAVVTSTGNTAPTVEAGANYSIPAQTMFTLSAVGSDINGNPLTYSWEERELGAATTLAAADNGSSPNYRVYNPVSSPERTFPRLSNVLSNTVTNVEKAYVMSRTADFMVVVRDNLGGINTDTVQLNVVGTAGPFRVTSPDTAVTLSGNHTVTWDVANTTDAPISAGLVNIKLSTDGGNTFPTTLLAGTPNDGSASVVLPNVNTTTARIRIEAAGNIFWDISNTNFAIIPAADVDDWQIYAD